MAIATLSSFVEVLCHASILEIEQREELLRIQDNYQSSRELAQELLRREWITAFQANQMLQGKAQDLQFGSFTLLERIGEGGMGQVYKARQRGLNRVVALKVIRRECLGNSKAVARFQREIRLAGQLAHPHIVRAYDADQVDGAYYIAMEFIDGVDLAHFVKKQGPLLVPQACDYIRQAALGLQYAYERGMVHRDIKPANLLVTQRVDKTHASSARVLRPNLKDPRGGGVIRRADFDFPWGMVKLLDLGLARWTDPDTGRSATQLTQLGSVMGTPEFIAPEQARDSHKIDIRADLYSLGCTLYFLLSGQVPFPNGSLTEKLLQHQFDVPESLSVVRRRRLMQKGTLPPDGLGVDVPYAIEEVVRRLMAKKPDDRHDTPAALADDLSNLIDQLAKGTLPDGPRSDASAVTEEVAALAPPEALSSDKSFDLKLESSTMLDKPIVAVKQRSKLATRGLRTKVAFVAAGLFVVLAGLMAAVATSRSGRPSAAEPAPKSDEIPWKKAVQKALAKRLGWDEIRQELVRLRAQNPAGPQAKEISDAIRLLPSAFDRFDRSRNVPVPAQKAFAFPELVGVLGTSKGYFKQPATQALVSPNGRWLAANDDALRVWETPATPLTLPTTGAPTTGAPSRVLRLAFAPDSRVLAVAQEDTTISLWDVPGRQKIRTLDKHTKPATRLAFSPDGATLASASSEGTIVLWDHANGSPRRSIDAHAKEIHSLAFSPDGQFVFWGSDAGEIRWARTQDGMSPNDWTLPTGAGPARVIAFQPGGRLVVCGGGDGKLLFASWDGQRLVEKARHDRNKMPVNEVAFAPDGRTFVAASSDHTVSLWDVANCRPERSWALHAPAVSAAFAPDGRHFVVGCSNALVCVFRLESHDLDALSKAIE